MDDAGGDRVEEHAQELEDEGKQLSKGIQNDEVHLDPSRWWFASAAFPMAAGTMGPVASAFSICALVRPWRQHIPPGSTITLAEYVDDPPWLLAVNAIQLVVALVANVFLLLNMARRVRFSLAQPVTIVGWYVSSFSLIALTATAAGPLRKEMEPELDYVWSQAFYYGIYAAILYLVIASLLVVTFLGALTGRYDKDFQLSTSQRTLMLQTIMLLMYLLVGALVFSRIEGWTYLDAVYWADVTLFTVGFGDMSAQTPLGRALLLPYALVGVISLGLVIGSIRSLALERGKRRLDARMIEKKRRRKVRQMTRKGTDDILVPIPDGDGGGGGGDEPSRGFASNGRTLTEFDRRAEEFELMRKIQHQAAVRRRWNAMAISSGTWVALWLVGAAVFQSCEAPYQHWSYFDGVYFAFVSLTTIGYGDVTPVSNSGKAFFVFWSLLALPTMTVLISNAGDTIVKGIRDGTNYLGTITILPGDRGTTQELKKFLHMLSCGKIFGEEDGDSVREMAPGFLGAAQPQRESDDSDDDEGEDEAGEDDGDDPEEDQRQAEEKLDKATDAAKGKNVNATRSEDASASASDSSPPATAASKPGVAPTTPKPFRRRSNDDERAGDDDSLPTLRRSATERSAQSTQTTQTAGSGTTHPPHRRARLVRRATTESGPRTDLPTALPASRTAYHLLLIDEIARVTQHLRHQPPRKYSFAEWAWYLRLVGEDEHSAETHRKAQPHVHHNHHHRGTGLFRLAEQGGVEHSETKLDEMRDAEEHRQWSWVGARSPLMGSQEEAEWILEKLTARLRAELAMVQKEEEEGGEGGGTGEGGKAGVMDVPADRQPS